jgi:hypothetical protein
MAIMAICITAVTLISTCCSFEYSFFLTAFTATIVIMLPAIPVLFLCDKALLSDKTISPIVY